MNSDNKFRLTSLALSGIGFLDSAYLAWVKLTHNEAYCGVLGDCQTVNTSPYSEIGGIPIALLGMGAYFFIFGLLYLESRGDYWEENAPIWVFGLTLVGVIYSAYLTYIEIAVLRAICPYCVVSAVIMLILFSISIVRIFRNYGELKLEESQGGD